MRPGLLLSRMTRKEMLLPLREADLTTWRSRRKDWRDRLAPAVMRRRLPILAVPLANPNRRRPADHVLGLVRAVVSLRGNRVEGIAQSALRTRAMKARRGPSGAETLCLSRSSRQLR